MKKRDLYYERIPTKLLREDFRLLGTFLGKVIKDQEGKNFFNIVEEVWEICGHVVFDNPSSRRKPTFEGPRVSNFKKN